MKPSYFQLSRAGKVLLCLWAAEALYAISLYCFQGIEIRTQLAGAIALGYAILILPLILASVGVGLWLALKEIRGSKKRWTAAFAFVVVASANIPFFLELRMPIFRLGSKATSALDQATQGAILEIESTP